MLEWGDPNQVQGEVWSSLFFVWGSGNYGEVVGDDTLIDESDGAFG